MAANALASAVTAVLGGTVIVLGVSVIRVSPTAIRVWIAGDRWFRRLNRRLFGIDWFPIERSFRRLTFWFVPRDVELKSPEDLYTYLLSERFRRRKLTRLWYGVAGAYLVVVGAIMIAMALYWLVSQPDGA